MGSYDGAEVCQLVGAFLLKRLADMFGPASIGPGACSAMGTGGTCTPQKCSIWVIAIVMYANML